MKTGIVILMLATLGRRNDDGAAETVAAIDTPNAI